MVDQSRTHEGLRELALFAGAGGGILGGVLLGWRTVCAVELDPYAASVLCARQNDGILPPFPIWGDIRTFDGRPWQGRVDVVSGGFPCQDISAAGKGAGITGERSGLWLEMARVISEVRPRFAFVENSPVLTSRGLGVVLGDLAEMGYDCRWGVIAAADVGAPHLRERIWIVANASGARRWENTGSAYEDESENEGGGTLQADLINSNGERNRTGDVADSNCTWKLQQERHQQDFRRWTSDGSEVRYPKNESPNANLSRLEGNQRSDSREKCKGIRNVNRNNWWNVEPDVGRMVNGLAARIHRLKAIGNGQVPAVARLAWEILSTAD